MRPNRRVLAGAVAALLIISAAWLFWDDHSRRSADRAGLGAMQAARDSIVAMLSYRPDTVEKDLDAARDRLTGRFLDDYTQLIKTVVIPDARQRTITATAQVPSAAVVSAEDDRVLVLAYVDQTMTVGTEKPAVTASTVRVSMEKVDGRWLVAAFEQI
jgi:Mce-associated membrane protein